jgi:hypothetical protein
MRDQLAVAAETINGGQEKERRRRVQRPQAAVLFVLIVVGLGISTLALLVYLSLMAYHSATGN